VLTDGFKHLALADIPGGGQVVVDGSYAYVGHMDPPHGTSILDISDPRNPVVLSTIRLQGDATHTHKVRVRGDIMVTNCERSRRGFWRRGRLAETWQAKLRAELGREPTIEEISAASGFAPDRIPDLLKSVHVPYDEGGFKIWDISDKRNPKLITYHRTGLEGAHRFDLDDRYLYLSTSYDGFIGNILVIYDISNPARPEEVSRWWMPGQNVAGGEVPTWHGTDTQLHHAMRLGNELWAGCWHAGVRGIDISDITRPKTIASWDCHPAFPHPTHTAMRVPFKVGGRDILIVADEEEESAYGPGRNHAFLWFLEIGAGNSLKPISTFHVAEHETPYAHDGHRFGVHQFQEHFFSGPLLFTAWFSAGLRLIDFSDPFEPTGVGHFIPDKRRPELNIQSNDIEVDSRGLVYLLDRFSGLDILEYKPR
jgi:hypothetical protein